MSSRETQRTRAYTVSGQKYFHPLISEYLIFLHKQGLSKSTIKNFPGPAKHFIVWLDRNEIDIPDIDGRVIRHFLRHKCNCPRPRGELYQNTASRNAAFKNRLLKFIEFLELSGQIKLPFESAVGVQVIEDFIVYLAETNYTDGTLGNYRNSCQHFLAWCSRERKPLENLQQSDVDAFIIHQCTCSGFFVLAKLRNQGYTLRIERFLRFLIYRGVVVSANSPFPASKRRDNLDGFRQWLHQNRGIKEVTIGSHLYKLGKLLPHIGDDPAQYTPAVFRQVIVNHLKGLSRGTLQSMTTTLRMYVRYLATQNRCNPALVNSIPTVPHWRLSTLPRYILEDDVERVIASCDITTLRGLRDRAIMLLLARLALRCGDVVNLRLQDIDWDNAVLRVSGKTNQFVGLPLPQDVGDSLLAYIQHARPQVAENKVFLRAIKPYVPFTSSHPVSLVVQEALKRSGVKNNNLRGAYLLRHSAATNMLRSGATLEAVSTLLRHRSIETTTIYAKVDTTMLLTVAQPWIGGTKC